MLKTILTLAMAATITQAPPSDQVVRKDWKVRGEVGHLGVREVRTARSARARPVILLHGARVPGVASFDLPVPGGSLAEDLARQGHRVIILDATGYGGSTRPTARTEPPGANGTLAPGGQVVQDIDQEAPRPRV